MTYLSLGFLATFSKQLHSLSSFLDTFWYILADFLGSGLFVYSHIYPGTCPKNVTNYLVSTYHVYHVYHVPYASYVTDVFAYSHICPGFRPKNVTNSSLSLSLDDVGAPARGHNPLEKNTMRGTCARRRRRHRTHAPV